MEKKEWMSKYKDFDERLREAEMLLKREQASHLIAISEMEKREENLRKALGLEKQCVVDVSFCILDFYFRMFIIFLNFHISYVCLMFHSSNIHGFVDIDILKLLSTLQLENSLREMLSQQSDVKINSDANLAEAQALKESFQNKSLEADSKLHAADAQLAEVNRKNSEVERKLHDLAVREEVLQREQVSLSKEYVSFTLLTFACLF